MAASMEPHASGMLAIHTPRLQFAASKATGKGAIAGGHIKKGSSLSRRLPQVTNAISPSLKPRRNSEDVKAAGFSSCAKGNVLVRRSIQIGETARSIAMYGKHYLSGWNQSSCLMATLPYRYCRHEELSSRSY